MHWTVGKVKITKVVELETVGSTRFILPLATNEEIQKLPWLIPHFATEEGRLKMSIHSLLVETPSRRIIVDTGLGNDKQGRNVPTWNNRKDPFLDTLTAAGFPPDSIDTVLCTHLHVDHVGWNTVLVGRQMGADIRQRPLRVRQDRVRTLARPQRGPGASGGVRRFREADRRCRQGRPRRQRCQACG
jgi:glyoxylase-like metal-dependent hydrolase (beta-lactamase superfamily II)